MVQGDDAAEPDLEVLGRVVVVRQRAVGMDVDLGFGRIVASEIEVPNLIVNMV